jgi:epoxide hydrolase-like predicted phosphatase
LRSALTTVIFDYGGVLGLPLDPQREAAMISLTGLSKEAFHAAYQQDRIDLDRGTLEADEYWRRVFTAAGVTVTSELLTRIEREDVLGWSRVNWRVVDWAYELRKAGYLTGILSNMPSEKLKFMRADRQFRWIEDFDVAVFSCEYKLVKPEPSIYKLCLQKLGTTPQECIFLDDVLANAEGARVVGINAMVFRSADESADELERDWGLPVGKLRNGSRGSAL